MRLDLSQKLVLGFTAAIAIGAGITPALHLLGAPGWGAFFVAMLLGVGLGWIYAGQITANFRTLRACTERISRGDLTAEVDIEAGRRFPDETVDLARSVDVMLQKLRELVEHIQRAADDVAQSSRDVADLVAEREQHEPRARRDHGERRLRRRRSSRRTSSRSARASTRSPSRCAPTPRPRAAPRR